MLAPLLRIETVADADLGPAPWAAVLLTSANGARAVASHPRHGELRALPVLAVGPGSADAARAAGFADVVSADGDGRDLARLAATRFAGARPPLLYLAGEDRARDLAASFRARPVGSHRRGLSGRPGGGVSAGGARRAGARPDRRRAAFFPPQRRQLPGLRPRPDRAGAGADTLLPVGAGRRAAALAGAAAVHVAAQPDEARLLALVTLVCKPDSNRLG